ncbi:DNA mismatch repair endonuclease MutL [Finegoldia magna]|uniref:DNA mismatch repair protein MutL n=1 Tax=Finegoldia magna BVS033A4 TaxID=866773 RepID=E1KVQ7_FINMA|nr:DNA mismatch repair endonuclease MutL [Finegoldia magna]EFL54896.1 DNA mismatch repair domain protein [Finegoldia magna BVS033A4]
MIKLLSEDTIQKIAAGEVIERPVSVIKELVENSIDAGSDTIIVEIKNGGKDYISVSDNGSGIEKNEIELAFKRHSTSKLEKFDDLYDIRTLGFRGEALASILAVSKLIVSTRTKSEKIGKKVEFRNSKVINKSDVAMNVGTKIVIKDLFYNVPVRKKFMKSDQTEANLITTTMYKFAICNTDVSIKYIKDNKTLFETKKNSSIKENIINLFGTSMSNNLIDIDISSHDYKIHGYISNNNLYRANRQMQYIFLNGRFIKSEDIRNTVESNYKSVIPNGRFPLFWLFFEINPKLVDVNVHPNKQKVKISILDEILEQLNKKVRFLLENNVRITNISQSIPDDKYKDLRRNYFESDSNLTNYKYDKVSEPTYSYNLFNENSKLSNLRNIRYKDESEAFNKKPETNKYFFKEKDVAKQDNLFLDEIEQIKVESYLAKYEKFDILTVLFKTYILAKDEYDSKIYLFDQHACHERINYEKLTKQMLDKEVVSQNLAFPINISLTDELMEIYTNNKSIFEELGYESDVFSDDSVVVRAVPYLFGNSNAEFLFTDILDTIAKNSNDPFDVIESKVIKRSCKMSVKAGDTLSNFEIIKLLEDLFKCEYPLTCPHGRPTFIEMNEKDLEKMFMRIK